MPGPGVPGGRGEVLELTCGERVDVYDLDLGLRELDCRCGETHAVVMDPHPLGRFVPEFLVDALRETVDTADEFEEFSIAHLMGMVVEEFPEAVASADVSEDGNVGYAVVWVTEFDGRRLHEIVVELIVELMEHAVSHADDEEAEREFERQMHSFDVATFVEQYRRERDFEDEFDTAV